jgi:hypothetical protein
MLLIQLSAAVCILSTAVAVPNIKRYPQSVDVVEVTDGAGGADVTGVVIEETVVIETEETRRGLMPICPNLNTTMDHGCIRCEQ